MRYSLKLWVVFIAFLNIIIFVIGLESMNIENKFDKYDEKTRHTENKIESRVFTKTFVKIHRRSDDKIHQIFDDKKFISVDQIEKNRIQPDKDIEKARLVGIIVPLEGSFLKTAIIEYDMPPRTLRLRQEDIIPGTNWKVKNINDREIILNNNSIDVKIKLK